MKMTKPTKFDGVEYQPELDFRRLSSQHRRVWTVMYCDEGWHTLREISGRTNAPEASVSAILRDFRKARNGGHTVERRRAGDPHDGLFEYRLVVNK